MTEEQKQLLLKDLCARLPYGVLCKLKNEILPLKDVFIDGVVGNKGQLGFGTNKYGRIFQEIDEIKPYLRPMESMTEEERKEVENLIKENRPNPYGIINNKGIDNLLFSVSVTSGVLTNWLNAHYFDYRGLIKKELALEAPEGMYNIKNE